MKLRHSTCTAQASDRTPTPEQDQPGRGPRDERDEVPVPPGEAPPAPVEDPPAPTGKAPIDEGRKEPKMYV
jgi:hypothetical protein